MPGEGEQSYLAGVIASVQKNLGTLWKAENSVWIEPTLLNSWVNYGGVYGPAAYFKDASGIVHLRGVLKDGTIGDFAAFTLPVGYRPAYQEIFVAISNNAIGRCDVYQNGDVMFRAGNNAYFSIDGMSFRTT